MRIGIDCRLWNESGVGRYIRNLVEYLAIIDRKNEYVLFVLSKDFESIKYTKWSVVRADIRWHTLEEQIRFPKILNRENLDLMHFPYVSVPIFYNKPFVVTVHDLIPYHYPTGKASTLALPLYKLKLLGYKFVIAQAVKKAKKIITVSNATKKEVVNHIKVSEDKIVVAYEGVDNKITNPKLQISNKSSVKARTSADKQNTKYKILNTKYFLYVGNAYPHKNLDRLLQALNILISQYPNISLVLVGKEDYFYKRLKEKVRNMGLEQSVNFLGEVSDEDLSSLYQNALALVIPSLMEGFGLPALEAMANRCLVLSSDIPGLKEVCGNAALYFDPYNLNDIVQKMKKIYPDSDYGVNIEKGVERTKMFSWQKMAKETLKVYEGSVNY